MSEKSRITTLNTVETCASNSRDACLSEKTTTLNRVRTGTRARREPWLLAALPSCPQLSPVPRYLYTADDRLLLWILWGKGENCRYATGVPQEHSNGSMPLYDTLSRIRATSLEIDIGQSGKKYKSLLKFLADYPAYFELRCETNAKGTYWIRLKD